MKIFTPATSANLGPGFDSLGLAIELFNEVEITKQSFSSLSINGEGDEKLNLRKKNIFVEIFNQIFYELSGAKQNFKFAFTNNIPFSRGLGSSSSVIVGAIAAAYEMSGFKVDKKVILNRALEFENHPDNIAPAVLGGFSVNIVKNGAVFSKRADLSSDLRAIMVIPNKPMSTAESRLALPKSYASKDAVSNLSHASFITACFMSGDYESLKMGAVDKMHEDYRMKGLPELFEVRKTAYENGALMSVLSGSGSSFLNLSFKNDAKKLKESLESKFSEFRVEIFELNNSGFVITKG